MRLGDWLKAKNKNASEFAPLIGVGVSAVTRYVNGDRVPRPEIMVKIFEETGGAVTANDFVIAPGGEQSARA